MVSRPINWLENPIAIGNPFALVRYYYPHYQVLRALPDEDSSSVCE
jgi:hypothetical protein